QKKSRLQLRVQPQAAPGWEARLFQSFAYGVNDPLFVGKRAGLLLGINQLFPNSEFKETAPRWYQLQALDVLLERDQQLVRQTDGLRLVPSHGTIRKREIHKQLTPEKKEAIH